MFLCLKAMTEKKFVINIWGNGTYVFVSVHEREENSHSAGRLLKGSVLGE